MLVSTKHAEMQPEDALYQGIRPAGSRRLSTTSWIPASRGVACEAASEARVRRVEDVRVQRVRDFLGTFSGFDRDLLLLDDLVWRDDIACPVPVRRAELTRSLHPFSTVVLVAASDLNGSALPRRASRVRVGVSHVAQPRWLPYRLRQLTCGPMRELPDSGEQHR